CSSSGGLKYISGDALRDSPDCIGPNNAPYPSATVARTFSGWSGVNNRRGRQSKFPQTLDPSVTQSALLRAYSEMNDDLFLVIPLGPVTLTGQDYVLVESGCVCKPKYSTGPLQEPNMIP
uniref:Uncharacterized protein n=1 Tax=Megaselia scalaris TaxID=36166 RepID=T1H648_MEGSC